MVLLCLLWPTMVWSQLCSIRGVVRDANDQSPVQGAMVWIAQNGVYAETSRDGLFVLQFSLPESTSLNVSAKLLGYETWQSSSINLKPGGQLRLDIALVPKQFDQPLVVIRPGVPDSVWGDARLSVVDFVHTSKGLTLLAGERERHMKLESEKGRRFYAGCEVIALDEAGRERFRTRMPEDMERLHYTFFGDVFAVGRNEVWWITENAEESLERINARAFYESLVPLVDSLPGRTIYSTWQADFPEFEYRIYHHSDSTSQRIRKIVNEPVMAMFRSSFKYLLPEDKRDAYQYELDTGIAKEIVAGYMSGFAKSNYFEPMNAPLFVSASDMLLFDHHHHKLVRFESSGSPIDSVSIRYHLNSQGKWGKQVYRDRVSGRFFTTMNKGSLTTLHEIDIHTGLTSSVRKLHWPWVSKVAVHNGWVYYLWRPYESAQRTWIYKERIGDE